MQIRPKNNSGVMLSDVAKTIGTSLPGRDIRVTGASMDNREIEAGDLFIAIPGERIHGAKFAALAVEAGAVAVLTDQQGSALAQVDVPVLVVDDVSGSAGSASALIMGEPATQLSTYAVTGTNGKTTTTFMLDAVLGALGRRTGLIGTVELRLAGIEIPAVLTTPQPADLQAMLASLVERNGTDLVMEVSSHALAQGRAKPVCFTVAGFTNLTQDHLDFHHTIDEYYEAKRLLFLPDHAQRCVITVDDDAGRQLFADISRLRGPETVALAVFSELPTLPEGCRGWQVREVSAGPDSTTFVVQSTDGIRMQTATSLPGDFNVANAALALVMAIEGGHDVHEIERVLGAAGVDPAVPGRMEVIGTSPRVVVDFAHNTDALRKAIEALRPTTEGRLIVLTGSAGERDRGKRPAMARTVTELADELIVTDDDPHGEDPAAIRRDLIAGIPQGRTWREIGDRTEAINVAIRDAQDVDTVLIAGRGHETIQEVAGVENYLDDRVVAREALGRRTSIRENE